ncbi:MAG: 3-dehydroquinate synthase [Syntrophobacteraceae bacterium]
MQLTLRLPGGEPRTSEIRIETGLMAQLPESVQRFAGKRRVFWIWDGHVWDLWSERCRRLGWPDREGGSVVLFAASEANKRLASVEGLARELVRAGADRGTVLVAVGGGVTGDVVGFLASIYMRGVPVFQVPTTLLGQVDSSIGGKTGVDLPEGKNLLGTFYQPSCIWMDPEFLSTLSPELFRQGMAEVIKTAVIGDRDLWDYLEDKTDAILKREPDALLRVVESCAAFKASVVEADEKESGRRRILNFGHTVGHAIEKVTGYEMAHGDAVSVGMVAASRLSGALGYFRDEDADRLEKLCAQWGLPVRMPAGMDPAGVVSAMRADKKRVAGDLHFILPVCIGETRECINPDPAVLLRVLEDLRP